MQSVEKWVTRSDAWTPEDDARLAALVLFHIRTGSTQLKAFEEAANELGRTAAACGYRWNGVVRKHHREEIDTAKHMRKSMHKPTVPESVYPVEPMAAAATSSESMKDVIKFLQTYDEQYQRLRRQMDVLEQTRVQLEERVQELQGQLTSAPEIIGGTVSPAQLEQDSRTLFAIMERARKLLEGDAARTRVE